MLRMYFVTGHVYIVVVCVVRTKYNSSECCKLTVFDSCRNLAFEFLLFISEFDC